MKRDPSITRSILLLATGAIAIVLIAIGLVRRGYVSLPILAANKDAIGAVSSIVTLMLILLGAVASYYRFFRGRTFSVRADLSIENDVIVSPNGALFHSISIGVKNVGSGAIWNPRPVLTMQSRKGSGIATSDIHDWLDFPTGDTPSLSVIEPGETVTFFARTMVPKDVWAVTFIVHLSSGQGDSWLCARTFANRAPKAEGQANPDAA